MKLDLVLDPDQRLQEVIRLIFAHASECSAARARVLLSMTADGIHFPRLRQTKGG